ncbi:MAG: hypothetical protein V1838_04685 [Patescibacteria group bacterium]
MPLIKGDLHFHSHHSACNRRHQAGQLVDYHADCGREAIKEVIAVSKIAYQLGYQYLAITNHAQFPTATLTASAADKHKLIDHNKEIKKIDTKQSPRGIHLLAGVETNIINNRGQVGLDNKILKKLDIVIAANHRPTKMLTRREIMDSFIGAANNPYVHIIGHLTRFIIKLKLEDWAEILDVCEKKGKIIEYNLNAPLYRAVIKQVAQRNLLVSFGTDTHPEMIIKPLHDHIKGDIIKATRAVKFLNQYGISTSRIINTYSWPRLKKLLK